MTTAPRPTLQLDPQALEFGSFTTRLLAHLIDTFLLLPLGLLTYYFTVERKVLWAVLTVATLSALYKPLMEGYLGWTFGKKLLRLRVVNQADLGPVTYNQAFLRYVPWALAFFTSVFVTVRLFENPDFAEVTDYVTYLEFMQDNSLSKSYLVSLLGNAPMFSAFFIVLDPMRRALHDRLGETYCIRLPKIETPTSSH